MIRFIWRGWWRHKERFILLLVGALIMSGGLSYLFSLSNDNKGTVDKYLEKSWRTSFDIVVRPKGSPDFSKQNQLVEPNFISNIQNGMTLDQYKQIKEIDGVQVAAPIATIGYLSSYYLGNKPKIKEPGIYKVVVKKMGRDGTKDKVLDQTVQYFQVGKKIVLDQDKFSSPDMGYSKEQLLVGIDPDQEAKLVGLKNATAVHGASRYFSSEDQSELSRQSKNETVKGTIPVLINPNSLEDGKVVYRFQKLKVDPSSLEKKMNSMDEKAFENYLGTLAVTNWNDEVIVTGKDAVNAIYHSMDQKNPFTGHKIKKGPLSFDENDYQNVFLKMIPIQYKKTLSPYSKRWPDAFEINDVKKKKNMFSSLFPGKYVYRQPTPFGNELPPTEEYPFTRYDHPNLKLHIVGVFDPDRLSLSKDPLTKLPVETYRPPEAQLVLDADGQPVNPPKHIQSTGDPLGWLTHPPTMLTTIDAAAKIIGDHPITAIRVKVKGVEHLSNASQAKVKHIAKVIEQKTGLKADIMLGSSPQPVLIHVKGHEGDLGWLEQFWIHLGTAFTLFHETTMGFSSIIAAVILVAIVYVLATHLVSLLARRKEFAVLLSIGWRNRDLVKLIFQESLLLAGFVMLVSWMIQGIFFAIYGSFSLKSFVLVGIFALVIYLLGALWPAVIVTKISPYEALRTGEVATLVKRIVKTKNRFLMVFNQLFGKFNRNILSIVSIAMPTALVAFFLFITFRLKGVFYTSWLGQYVAMHVGPTHFIAMGIALVIAILTTTEIMWQNISERRREFAILKAIGWRHSSIRFLILLEGMLIGLLSGVIGVGIAMVSIIFVYGSLPSAVMPILLLSGMIPIVVGVIGSILPSEIAVKVKPSEGLRAG
ncbi:ABC transporter permease [Camelliibacillus cellulosilyticus]|uniref:ABC transporter permease n=1 Tax=Camelliibacillus cellulosilyticus TaxID=2174486 RepID=A0ABV9GL67_9BACL